MEGKTCVVLILVAGLALLQRTNAKRWPECTNQTDLVKEYGNLFEAHVNNYVVKREMAWTHNCWHASIISDEDDESLFSTQIYECCGVCYYPEFTMCTLSGEDDWTCGSQAYACLYNCRDDDSVLEAVVSASELNLDRKRDIELVDSNITDAQATKVRKNLRALRKQKKCYEKKCWMENGVRECCLLNTCAKVNDLVGELKERKKSRAKYLKKLRKGKRSATSSSSKKKKK